MKTTTIPLGLALLSGIAVAREPQEPEGHRPPPPVPPILAIFDADRDGTISADEIDAASDALEKLDGNQDGQITREELRPPNGHRPPQPPVIAALDTDRDGTLCGDELEGAPDSLLGLDMNGDGELSPQEIHPHGPPPPPPAQAGEPE